MDDRRREVGQPRRPVRRSRAAARECGRARGPATPGRAAPRRPRRPPRRAARDRTDPHATRLLATTTGWMVLGDYARLNRSLSPAPHIIEIAMPQPARLGYGPGHLTYITFERSGMAYGIFNGSEHD